MKKQSQYVWYFDTAQWAAKIMEGIAMIGEENLAREMDVTVGHLRAWVRGIDNTPTPYPAMSNFIKFCRLMDCDPREFWEIRK